MNWRVPATGLRKTPGDLLPPDTILLDLKSDDDIILEHLKPKTRYKIRCVSVA